MKTKIIDLQNVAYLFLSLVMLFTATIVPLTGSQLIAGPIVNAILFLSVLFLGARVAILIAVVPSVIALLTGLLPFLLAPMIPFIITGNIILVFTFNNLKDSFLKGVLIASFLKFFFLFVSGFLVINFAIKETVIVSMMGWVQLFTALTGGLIAHLFYRLLK